MDTNKKELEQEELEQADGGSFVRPEAKIRAAGIDLLKEDGTPGEFGYLWNTGDYYFQGEELSDNAVNALIQYQKEHGVIAPSLQVALDSYIGHRKRRK